MNNIDDDGVWVQLATRIPRELHRELKLHCVESDVSLMAFVIKALEDRLEREQGRAVSNCRPRPKPQPPAPVAQLDLAFHETTPPRHVPDDGIDAWRSTMRERLLHDDDD